MEKYTIKDIRLFSTVHVFEVPAHINTCFFNSFICVLKKYKKYEFSFNILSHRNPHTEKSELFFQVYFITVIDQCALS